MTVMRPDDWTKQENLDIVAFKRLSRFWYDCIGLMPGSAKVDIPI